MEEIKKQPYIMVVYDTPTSNEKKLYGFYIDGYNGDSIPSDVTENTNGTDVSYPTHRILISEDIHKIILEKCYNKVSDYKSMNDKAEASQDKIYVDANNLSSYMCVNEIILPPREKTELEILTEAVEQLTLTVLRS